LEKRARTLEILQILGADQGGIPAVYDGFDRFLVIRNGKSEKNKYDVACDDVKVVIVDGD
jgi:hypothetical protein